ncbi:hypothetical protein [Shewanella putrefaciens]|uniref:hypothetical protein n=1 Tax=Shewanella putrefaciens TaxID=24 RepID=UPI003463BDA1
MNTFSTTAGVVTLSKPYFTLMCDQQQIEVKYTPNHCQGWGICKVFNAIECSDFSQADAELFALNAESKLKLTGEISMTLYKQRLLNGLKVIGPIQTYPSG